MNDRSLEAFEQVRPGTKQQRSLILAEFFALGRTGSIAETVTRKVLGPKLDKTGAARMSELKGIALNHEIFLVRTGEKRPTELKKDADVFIHVAFATPEEIEDHIDWIIAERANRAADHVRWAQKLSAAGRPVVGKY